jgi:hypothetical protein
MLIPKTPHAEARGIAPTARMQRGMSRRELLDVLIGWEHRTEFFTPVREDLAVLRETMSKMINGPMDPVEMPFIEADCDVLVQRPDGSRYRGYVDAISFERDKTLHPPNSAPVTTLGAVFTRIVLSRPFVSTLADPDGE